MGTITVFLAPFYALFVWISSLFGVLMGDNLAKVELPYNPENGLVWEYDDVDDPYIRLQKTEIKDGKQIFYFKHKTVLENTCYGQAMDLIFTDKNGNSLKYYAYPYQEGYTTYETIKILAPGEYLEFSYTPTPQLEASEYRWSIDLDDEFCVLHYKDGIATEKTFTFIYEIGSNEYNMISVGYSISPAGPHDSYENCFVHVDFSSGEGVITKEYSSIINLK